MSSLAIGFSGNSVRMAALSDNNQLSFISELETDFDFDSEIPEHFGDEHLVSELASVISENLIKIENISAHTLCVGINSVQTFCNVMPLEMELEEQVISSNILWDLSMYYPDDYENFNINYYRLKKIYSDENIYKVLVLGINRNVINFYKAIFDECELRINIFDSDHLAVSRYVNEFYPSGAANEGNYILLGLKPGRVDISLNDKDSVKYYNYASTGDFDFKNELDSELDSLELDENSRNVNKIFIYGESLLESVKEYLEQKYNETEVTILDPLETYGSNGSSENIFHFSSASRFAPLFGLALKGLDS